MYRKLDQEALDRLMEAGIREFAQKGFDRANVSEIAGNAGLSVGVLYKYYQGKDDYFLHCIRHSLKPLQELMEQIEFKSDDLEENMEVILKCLFQNAREHNHYYLLYHEITSGGCRKFADQLAEEIETVTSGVYYRLIEDARQKGWVRQDMDPAMFAFFFDNLLMMLHFSLSCDYYKKRMEIFCRTQPDEEKLIRELLKFLSGALGIKREVE